MPIEIRVEGRGLRELQRKLKATNDGKVILRELNKEMRDIGRELIPVAREANRENLPRGGGLNERVADYPMRAVMSSSKSDTGVRIVGKGMRAADRGFIRHPVYARPDKARSEWTWVTQRVRPSGATDALRASAPKIRPALVRAMDRAAKRLAAS